MHVTEKQKHLTRYKTPGVKRPIVSLISIFHHYNFCPLSDPVKQDPIVDQFSMITI